MIKDIKQSGFSIAEILIALGILTVAMVFIAGVFPVGIYFTQKNVDNTTAAIAANEAFAKIRFYNKQLPDVNYTNFGLVSEQQRDFNDWFMYRNDIDTLETLIDANTFLYPSDPLIDEGKKKYCWSALCRLIVKDANIPKENELDVQVTVFVFNRGNHNLKYYKADLGDGDSSSYSSNFTSNSYGQILTDEYSKIPQPVRVEIDQVQGVENEIQVQQAGQEVLISDGDLLVDDYTGEIYRVLQRYPSPDDDIVALDKKWQRPNSISRYYMWVVPPAVAAGGRANEINLSGKSPCVGIYQKVIRF